MLAELGAAVRPLVLAELAAQGCRMAFLSQTRCCMIASRAKTPIKGLTVKAQTAFLGKEVEALAKAESLAEWAASAEVEALAPVAALAALAEWAEVEALAPVAALAALAEWAEVEALAEWAAPPQSSLFGIKGIKMTHYAHITGATVDLVLRVAPHSVFGEPYASEFIPCPQEVGVGWLYDGSSFTPPTPTPAPAPTSCTPAQGLIALYAIKQLTEQDILDAIAQIPDPVQRYTATIGYQRATTWQRGSATMATLAQLLGLTDADLDALFAYAAEVAV